MLDSSLIPTFDLQLSILTFVLIRMPTPILVFGIGSRASGMLKSVLY